MATHAKPPDLPGRRPPRRVRVWCHDGSAALGGRATVAVEEPLEIRIDGTVAATRMRTPGHDFDLALGVAITDAGVVPSRIARMSYCGRDAGEVSPSKSAADLSGPYVGGFNVVNVATRDGTWDPIHRHRPTPINSARGICGADVIADLVARAGSAGADPMRLDAATIAAIPRTARAARQGIGATGAIHAAAVFNPEGTLMVLREDVGNDNAVDKVIGALAARGALPAPGLVMFTSGRVAFETIAKSLIAGFTAVVAMSAPTSLAVSAAEVGGLTLVGSARGDAFTVYSRPDRIAYALGDQD